MQIKTLIQELNYYINSQLKNNPKNYEIEGDVYSFKILKNKTSYGIGCISDGPTQSNIEFTIPENVLVKNNINKPDDLIEKHVIFNVTPKMYGNKLQTNVTEIFVIDISNKINLLNDTLKKYEQFEIPQEIYPKYFRNIAVIGKENTNGMNDFKKRISEGMQFFVISYEYVDTLNAENIADAINRAAEKEIDAICIIRGGGDKSNDLFYFNDPKVLDAIVRARITKGKYIITGIGHSDDFFICEKLANYAADVPFQAADALVKAYYYNYKRKSITSDMSAPHKNNIPWKHIVIILIIVAILYRLLFN